MTHQICLVGTLKRGRNALNYAGWWLDSMVMPFSSMNRAGWIRVGRPRSFPMGVEWGGVSSSNCLKGEFPSWRDWFGSMADIHDRPVRSLVLQPLPDSVRKPLSVAEPDRADLPLENSL